MYRRTFLGGLTFGTTRQSGYVVGQNFFVEARFAEGQTERLSDLAANLVARQVDAIVAPTGRPIFAAREATPTIPIVIVGALDPVGTGLAAK
jgi:ABC-type uncharacterized transport system substrate-binding protein